MRDREERGFPKLRMTHTQDRESTGTSPGNHRKPRWTVGGPRNGRHWGEQRRAPRTSAARRLDGAPGEARWPIDRAHPVRIALFWPRSYRRTSLPSMVRAARLATEHGVRLTFQRSDSGASR